MIKKNKGLLGLVGLILFVYAAYSFFFPTYQWNEKLSVNVSTPEGSKSGHSVRFAKVWFGPDLLPDVNGKEYTYRGEATLVELGNGKHLFALLAGKVGWARHAYRAHFAKNKYELDESTKNISKLRGNGPIALPSNTYPLLVTFDDINDPTSVKEVDPANLAATFGPGYSLNSITLDITDDPVTHGEVEKVLGWLDQIAKTQLDGQRLRSANAANQLANSLNIVSLVRK